MHLAQGVWREHRGLPHMGELLANWLPQGESPFRRGWEWFYLNATPYQNLHTPRRVGARPGRVPSRGTLASKRLAAGTADGVIRIWDVDREKTTLTLIGPGRSSGGWWGIRWLAWSPDGGKLAGGFHDGTIHVWDSRSGRELGVFREHKTPILAVAYSSDGRRLASWEDNGTIKIRVVNTGRVIGGHPPGRRSLRGKPSSPDDKLLATGHHDGTVTISDAHAGGTIARLRDYVDLIYDLASRPPAARLASAGGDFTARIWEVASEPVKESPFSSTDIDTSGSWREYVRMDTPSDRDPPRPEQPTLFAMPADDDAPPRPAEPPLPPGRPRLRTANRQQIVFRTAALDDLIPPDHPARIVWEFVVGLDLSPLYEPIKSVAGNAGRPCIDPKILMALWTYATIDGVGSARQLAKLCGAHDAYRWLLGDVAINYHTLADFRTDHVELLDRLLTESVAALMAEGLVDLERVAQDGMRVRASAGAASFRRRPTLEEALAEAEAQVRALRAELEQDPAAGDRRRQAARERAARERADRIRDALDRLPELEARKKPEDREKRDARPPTRTRR